MAWASPAWGQGTVLEAALLDQARLRPPAEGCRPEGLADGVHPGQAGLLFLARGSAVAEPGRRREAVLAAEREAQDRLALALGQVLAEGRIAAVFPQPWPDRPLSRALREAARVATLRGNALEREVRRTDAEFRLPPVSPAQAAALAEGAAAARRRGISEAAPQLSLSALPAALCEAAGEITLVLAWSAWLDAAMTLPAPWARQPLPDQWRQAQARPRPVSVWVDERGRRVLAGFGADLAEATFWLRRRMALSLELRAAEALAFAGNGLPWPGIEQLRQRAEQRLARPGPALQWVPTPAASGGYVVQTLPTSRTDY